MGGTTDTVVNYFIEKFVVLFSQTKRVVSSFLLLKVSHIVSHFPTAFLLYTHFGFHINESLAIVVVLYYYLYIYLKIGITKKKLYTLELTAYEPVCRYG